MGEYVRYYHDDRIHDSLEKDTPNRRQFGTSVAPSLRRQKPAMFLPVGEALLRIVLHVEIAREPFASRAALHAYRFLVSHAPAQRDQIVAALGG